MLMSQPRQFHPHQHQHHHHHMMGGGGGGGQFNDTTLTKIFVGGLAWETQRDTMRNYFEQFGEILEAVVITDKATGRSKGYGFVTFKDPESAFRACQNPAPVIDGRKANCNLASLGAQKNRPTANHHVGSGQGWFRAGGLAQGLVAPPAAAAPFPAAASAYLQLQQSTFPYSAYGYTGFSHDNTTMYPMSYYGVYGGQNLSQYYTGGVGVGVGGGGSGAGGYFPNYYSPSPYYGPYGASQGSLAQQHGGYGVHQYQQQYSTYLPGQHHQHASPGILSLPTSLALPPPNPPISSAGPAAVTITVQGGGSGGGGGASSTVSEHNSSST